MICGSLVLSFLTSRDVPHLCVWPLRERGQADRITEWEWRAAHNEGRRVIPIGRRVQPHLIGHLTLWNIVPGTSWEDIVIAAFLYARVISYLTHHGPNTFGFHISASEASTWQPGDKEDQKQEEANSTMCFLSSALKAECGHGWRSAPKRCEPSRATFSFKHRQRVFTWPVPT